MVVLLLSVLIGCGQETVVQETVMNEPYVLIQTEEGDVRIKVEIADEQKEWEQGLMERTKLDDLTGMLFIFPDERKRRFWMKNTYIPLDILFIDTDGKVLNIEKATPCNSEVNCPLYKSAAAAKYVLEVEAGLCEKYRITPGVIIKLFI